MIYRGTITEMLLKALLYKTHSFREVEEMVKKYKPNKEVSRISILNTLYRLKKRGLVTKTASGWSANKTTKSALANRSNFNKNYFSKNKKDGQIKEMIVMYDIPENLRAKRERLREGLKALEFKQKQQSVWIGPAPLPKEFIKYLAELKIIKFINFFQVKEKDIV
ncbi:MAG: hypothetical protein QY304_02770 [Candidatus Paceibacterota bacterium]|nr:MAG: hypothetical protein QY304_02770 [Candidatus Paceibacterota bacterium]